MAAKEGVTRTWAIATEGMCEMMENVGISTRDEDPEFVVLGYDTEIITKNFHSLHSHAQGVPIVASHPVVVCPSQMADYRMWSVLAMLKVTTGKDPVHITGNQTLE